MIYRDPDTGEWIDPMADITGRRPHSAPRKVDAVARLTRTQRKRYVEVEGIICPWCQSKALKLGEITMDEFTFIRQTVVCLSCNKRWKDIYELTDIAED